MEGRINGLHGHPKRFLLATGFVTDGKDALSTASPKERKLWREPRCLAKGLTFEAFEQTTNQTERAGK